MQTELIYVYMKRLKRRYITRLQDGITQRLSIETLHVAARGVISHDHTTISRSVTQNSDITCSRVRRYITRCLKASRGSTRHFDFRCTTHAALLHTQKQKGIASQSTKWRHAEGRTA